MVASFFVGLGPGGLNYIDLSVPVGVLAVSCLPGSSHGGNVPPTQYVQLGDSYDKENLATFLGGSGGDAIHSISVCLFLTSLPRRRSKMDEISQIFSLPQFLEFKRD